MLKNLTVLEVKKGDRTYHFLCNPGSPLGEVYDALNEMRAEIFGIMKKAEEDAKKPAEEQLNG